MSRSKYSVSRKAFEQAANHHGDTDRNISLTNVTPDHMITLSHIPETVMSEFLYFNNIMSYK